MHERHDLDGRRLQRPGEPDVWLIFNGKRHRIASPQVYEALFANPDGLTQDVDPSEVSEGAPLDDGTCLIRPDNAVSYYLLTKGDAGLVRRHLVLNWESWCEFGFDDTKLIIVPWLVLEGVPIGRDLSTRNGRRLLS